MLAVAVDDDAISLECLKAVLEHTTCISQVVAFQNPLELLDWSGHNRPDVTFLDIKMQGMNGIALAQRLQKRFPSCPVIFVTAYDRFAVNAYQIHASGYIMKPVTKEAVERELRYILDKRPPCVRRTAIRAQCFGNFEVFVNDIPLRFRHAKTKELLAYLIYRKGATCSVRELAAVLFDEKGDTANQQSRLRKLFADLLRTLQEVGAEKAVYKARGCAAIVPHEIECDYYAFLAADGKPPLPYYGEFMAQYSWAEPVAGYFIKK